MPEVLSPSQAGQARPDARDVHDQALETFLRQHPRLCVLTGAGCSTASGLGDYRDRDGQWKRSQPVTGQVFLADERARKRYWARSAVGWPTFSTAQPGLAHTALATLQSHGCLTGLITQNVDRLHQKAGHVGVIDLHGVLATVSCIECGWSLSRDEFQSQLLADNPRLASLDASHAPDGDADLEHASFDRLEIPACQLCRGLLKPDVVFFGENVPKSRVASAMSSLQQADALLVAGSSLMVYSGFRFCRQAAAMSKPIALVNQGRTRADELASVKAEGDCGMRLQRLAQTLSGTSQAD